METKQFYITLPSNSQESNTASTFITELPRQIVLSGEWEVGLSEIIYANTWHNVAKGQNSVRFYDYKNGQTMTMQIPAARYRKIDDLVEALNKAVMGAGFKGNYDYKPNLHFHYSEPRRVCQVVIDPTAIKDIRFSKHLMYMLGFLNVQFDSLDYSSKTGYRVTAHHAPDMLGGIHNLFVYCDVVEPQIVGNVFAPLLQVVNVEGTYMQIINHSYISPHYVPVLKKTFNTIEINVKTDQDQPVPFDFGKTIVKLHFRKV